MLTRLLTGCGACGSGAEHAWRGGSVSVETETGLAGGRELGSSVTQRQQAAPAVCDRRLKEQSPQRGLSVQLPQLLPLDSQGNPTPGS